MKNIISAILTLSIMISCSDESITDPLAGPWIYKSSGSGPVIDAKFDLRSNGGGFAITEIELTVDGELDSNLDQYGAFALEVTPKSIKQISITKFSNNGQVIKGIAFFKLESDNGRQWTVDSVMYLNESLIKFGYVNQELIKN
jgi:hypothetical protein